MTTVLLCVGFFVFGAFWGVYGNRLATKDDYHKLYKNLEHEAQWAMVNNYTHLQMRLENQLAGLRLFWHVHFDGFHIDWKKRRELRDAIEEDAGE